MRALALFARGQATDNQYAVNIASALDYALHHDNYGDPIPATQGFAGLHSAYEGGDLGFLNSQPSSIAINDDAAVTTVVLSVDGVPVGTTQYGILRSDVCTTYPARAGCPNVGWNFTLDTTVLANGQHTLDVTATAATVQRATIGTPFEVRNWCLARRERQARCEMSAPE